MFLIGGIYPLIDNWRTNDCADYYVAPLLINYTLAKSGSTNYTMDQYTIDKAAFIETLPYKKSKDGCTTAF